MHVFIVGFFLLGFTSLKAVIKTDTHTYSHFKEHDELHILNKKTGKGIIYNLGGCCRDFVIYRNVGYVVNWDKSIIYVLDLKSQKFIHEIPVGSLPGQILFDGSKGYVTNKLSNTVSVLDLITFKVTHTIPVGHSPREMVIHSQVGYVVNKDSNALSVVDLGCNRVLRTIKVGREPSKMVIHEGFGYVNNWKSSNLSVIDLQTQTVVQTIGVGDYPRDVVISKGLGYVVNHGSNTVSVIDLKNHRVCDTIPVGEDPEQIVIQDGCGYVVNLRSHTLSVIDLETHHVMRMIPVAMFPSCMVIHNSYGYVRHLNSKNISVVDLINLEIIQTFENPKDECLDFTKNKIILGPNTRHPLPVRTFKLFIRDYTGIDEPLTESDVDAAFDKFESAALIKDYRAAKKQFSIALAGGCKKAYTVAFKAFLKGYWGAVQSDYWAGEFCVYVDWAYYDRIGDNPHEFMLASVPGR